MDHFPKVTTQELVRWLRSERASEVYAISISDSRHLGEVRTRIARLKETLALRENVPNKAQRKKIRQDAAKYGRIS
jgi:hypothetical protein